MANTLPKFHFWADNVFTTVETEGSIPRISVTGKTIPIVWENAVLATWFNGCRIKTQYDKPDDPLSRDCMIFMSIEDPFAEPRIHKCFPGSFGDLEVYRQEVVEGIHDHWIDISEGSTKWLYTYHDRLFNYNSNYPNQGKTVNQISNIICKLAVKPYSRQEEAITWYPWFDTTCYDPPCLQRIWCRMLQDDDGIYYLNMNVDMRSWDAFKAAFMNLWAFSDLQRLIADGISDIRNEEIRIGPLSATGNSFHIYGSYFKDSTLPMSFQGFLESIENRTFESRVIRSDDENVQDEIREVREKLSQELRS